MKHYWFLRKKYGWGWYPASWQGWSILALYFVGIAAAAINTNIGIDETALWAFLPEVLFYTVLLLVICYQTGESPKWQWGPKK